MAQNPTISKMETTQTYDYKMKSTQTAVEWLKERYNQGSDYEKHLTEDEFEQAKQMEKQQLANTWDAACDSYILLEGNLVKVWKDFDKYYNDNYGSNNQI